MSRAGYPWWIGPGSAAAAGLLEALTRSWRVERITVDEFAGTVARGEGCIFALWHARLLPLTLLHRGSGAVALVSRHRDGEIIARIVERLGYDTARGSSTRGGEVGMREMLEAASQRRMLAITPDGPRGPAERVKPGLVYLASQSGLPVIPVAAAGAPSWTFRSWDRFRVPCPFARVALAYAPPIRIPAGLDAAAAESWRARLEEAIGAVTRLAIDRVGETP